MGAYVLPYELLLKAQALERIRTALTFGGAGWTLALLFLLVRARTGARIAALAGSIVGRRNSARPRPFLEGLIVAPAWLLPLALVGLPPEAVGHAASLRYGLSVEGWGAWLGDWALATLLTVLLGTGILAVLYALLRRRPRTAWLWFSVASLPCIAAAVYLSPLVIDPLFNHFTPLATRAPNVAAELGRVAARGGLTISPSRMFVMDASRRSTGLNAYVTGFGGSKRIVVWDTALPGGATGKAVGAGVPLEELLMIYGHEQGHYVLGHIWKGMLYTAALLLPGCFLLFRLLEAVARRWGEAWHISENPADWSSLGLLLLLFSGLSFLADPLANSFSRMEEHQADVYGQEAVHGLVPDPRAVATADFNRLGRAWLEDPAPNRFVVWWSYSHPPIGDRAAFSAGYDPWVRGGRGRYFAR